MEEQWKFNEWICELAEPFWLKDAQKDGEFFDANGFARALLSASKPAAPKVQLTPREIAALKDLKFLLTHPHFAVRCAVDEAWPIIKRLAATPAAPSADAQDCKDPCRTILRSLLEYIDKEGPAAQQWQEISDVCERGWRALDGDHHAADGISSADAQDERGATAISLTGSQLLEALNFIAPDRATDPDQLDGEVTIQHGDGHSGRGLYCWLGEYPEEGATLLTGEISAYPSAHKLDERGADWERQLKRAMDLLDRSLGDSDPMIDDDMPQEEIEAEYPVMCAMQILTDLFVALQSPSHPTDAAAPAQSVAK
jgi:hypothetical protein